MLPSMALRKPDYFLLTPTLYYVLLNWTQATFTPALRTLPEMSAAQPTFPPDAGNSDQPHISAKAVQPSVSSDSGNADAPHISDEMIQGAPCEPNESTTESRPDVNNAPQSPMSKKFVIPKVQEAKNNKVEHTPLPKPVTGVKFREIIEQKRLDKEAVEKAKMERQPDRDRKRKKREEAKEKKKAEKDEKRRQKINVAREKKRKKSEMRARILQALEESSGGEGIKVADGHCYACERSYDVNIDCTMCYRRFHMECVEDDYLDDVPFECIYC
ncbi:hypothetical protein DPMN_088250 [Dreissena polymorpha]|uniref:PHD-type domain-containing protein n=1 Tax=Dreissena polymorpha TaxID=45954 RepID=A0A9D4QXP9_DREPO|nr:hypothetical protein DPMN_088250 [Dreissena polymorpha]